MTSKDWYNVIADILNDSDAPEAEGALQFVQSRIDQIDAKSEKARIKAAEKRDAGDALRDAIQDVLESELSKSVATIMEELDYDGDVTRGKVVARLTQLVAAGIVVREQVRHDGHKVSMYSLAA